MGKLRLLILADAPHVLGNDGDSFRITRESLAPPLGPLRHAAIGPFRGLLVYGLLVTFSQTRNRYNHGRQGLLAAMHAPDPIEDAINARADAERKTPGVSFAPVYAFVSNIAHIARGQERQTILDAVTAGREPGHSEEWNAGYDAALRAAIRILVERSFTH